MNKKFFIALFLALFVSVSFAHADIDLNDDKIDIDLFYSRTCPHCAQETDFLKELSLEDSNLDIERYEISEDGVYEKLISYFDEYNVPEEYRVGVPVTFIEGSCFVGFQGGDSIRQFIDDLKNNQETNSCPMDQNVNSVSTFEDLSRQIDLPVIGTIKLTANSPFLLSVIFGLLDGFNACAMAALAFLLAVLIGIGSRKKLVLVGSVFILVSGLVYFFFIASWLNIFLLLPHLDILTIIVGIVVLVFGAYVLKDYFDGVICKLCEINPQKENWFSKTQKKLMLKMQSILNSKMPLISILIGVSVVAAGINLIELVCSFGLPVAFTKILTSLDLSQASYYFYLLIYVFFYMLDDLIIFLIAAFTFNLTQESEKYLKIVKLISGLLLVFLGIIMIFFPDLLGIV